MRATVDREVISMWALGVFAGLVGAGTLAWYFVGRDNVPPMERHLRAIDALRDLAEHPRPARTLVDPPPEMPSEHIRILAEAPAGTRPVRRGTTRRPNAASGRARTGARRPTKPRASAPRSTPAPERTTIEIRPGATSRPPLAPVPVPLDAAAAPPPEWARPEPTLEPIATEPTASEPGAGRIARHLEESSRTYAAVGSAVGVVLVVLLVAAGLGGHRGNGGASRATQRVTPQRSAVPTTVPSPPTTAPVVAAPVVARSNNGATISVRSPFQITLRARGTCWVQVTDPSGRTLFTATLHSGQEQLIPGATPIVVRLGYTPAVSIAVDGVGIDLSGLSQTANLNFQTA